MQYRCVPSALTVLADVYETKVTGAFFALATAMGFSDVLSSPSSRLTVFAPSDFAFHDQYGGLPPVVSDSSKSE